MAENPNITLKFGGRCPDCAELHVELPSPLPQIGDDFDWLVRDYDGFRRFMLEELAARFPERTRWTPADMEVVLMELLAAVLDQLSDMADRVASESYLETARRPESVRRLLSLIGFDMAIEAGFHDDIPGTPNPRTKEQKLEHLWRRNPNLMETAKREGPMAIHTQRRMVTVEDYAARLLDHPLVMRATAWERWSGSWTTIYVAVVLWNNYPLDEEKLSFPEELKGKINMFHQKHFLPEPMYDIDPPTMRALLRPYLDTMRMIGQEVLLQDTTAVGIKMAISIRVAENYFRSEVRHAVEQALGTNPGGFFEPGRLNFGEDVFAGDLFQTLMSLDGVENVCLNRFKRFGDQYPDQVNNGVISLQGLEIAVCDNNPVYPERGFFNLKFSGGRKG